MKDEDVLKKVEEVFYKTAIWKHFDEKAENESKVMVENLVKYCAPILDRIIETFPTYTLHNNQHQLNILSLYSELLGPRLKDLSALETAILILSAFFHDIGMVYSKEERENLQKEDLFSVFLEKNLSAKLLLDKIKESNDENSELHDELAKWYCRWAHAKRVWVYLDQKNDDLLWGDNNIREKLGYVCESHDEAARFIKEKDEISIDYWRGADLKFCAILLRLADILDFDKSRTPESVYIHLGLDQPKSQSAQKSHEEWSKHLASGGFDFKDWSKTSGYTLYYKASPDHPAVENDIKQFLDIIENELQECREALRSCSDRWRGFQLPEKIDRTNILSQGYTTGDFKFTLDQKQILHLLMGDKLYQNSNVFMRELLQNAIDTSRYRVKHEKNNGKPEYEVQPIKISSWSDSAGFRWIRIDDYGMGMTLDQIEKYFLKIGNSLYNSDEFKVSKLDYAKTDRDFTPVSRFGIGILSCFMVADEIEVSTKSVYCDRSTTYPIRLSLQGIDSYYFLYTNNDIAKEMPNEQGNEKEYREEIGTSIALKIHPNHDRDLNIHKLLGKLIYASEVPVEYEGVAYGTEQLKDLPSETKIYKLTDDEVNQIKEFIGDPDLEMSPEIHRVPVPLAHDKVKNAQGMLYVFLFRANVTFLGDAYDADTSLWEYFDIYNSENVNKLSLSLNYERRTPNLTLKLEETDKHDNQERELQISLNHLISDLDEFNSKKVYGEIRQKVLLSHNGVIIPNKPDGFSNGAKLELDIKENSSDESICLGVINLKDDLRPDLNIARDKISSLPWNCFSQINFLTRKCLDNSEYNFEEGISYFDSYSIKDIDHNEIINDPLIRNDDGWPEVITVGDNGISVKSIGENSKIKVGVFHRYDYGKGHFLEKKVIFNNCVYTIKLSKKKKKEPKENESEFELVREAFIVGRRKYHSTSFPSHIVCEYENFNGLMPLELDSQLYNINHHFTKWLQLAYSELLNNYPNYLKSILESSSPFEPFFNPTFKPYLIEDLNADLSQLKKLLPKDLRPDFTLSASDFEVDFDTLEEVE